MNTETKRSAESGFSLIELMTALAITLIVSSAIYGLMAQGQGSFQREPQLTDRQQNVRIAMDLIERDLANAGRGLPLVGQVFVNNLDAFGPAGLDETRTVQATDQLEMILADPHCQSQLVCSPATGTVTGAQGTYSTMERTLTNNCLAPPTGARTAPVLLADKRLFSVHIPDPAGATDTACPAGAGANGAMALGAQLANYGTPWVGSGTVAMYAAQIVRYRLTDAAADPQGIQNLERSETVDGAGNHLGWQVVARGIENLQVRYMRFDNTWADTPGVVAFCPVAGCTAANFNAVTTNVRVTLQARTIASNVLGPVGDHAIRGQLTTIVSPRAAATALELAAHDQLVVYN